MSTQAFIGHGTLFQLLGNESPADWETVAEVKNVTPPGISRDLPDATHMQSPDGYREFILGLKDGGEISLELNFTEASVATMMAEFAKSEMSQCRIVLPTGATWEATVGLSGFESEDPVDDIVTATATFKVSGKPVFEAAP